MPGEGYHVRRVKDAHPEKFVIIHLDADLPKDSFIKLSDGLTENELRARLKKDFGRTDSEADSVIQAARENPPV